MTDSAVPGRLVPAAVTRGRGTSRSAGPARSRWPTTGRAWRSSVRDRATIPPGTSGSSMSRTPRSGWSSARRWRATSSISDEERDRRERAAGDAHGVTAYAADRARLDGGRRDGGPAVPGRPGRRRRARAGAGGAGRRSIRGRIRPGAGSPTSRTVRSACSTSRAARTGCSRTTTTPTSRGVCPTSSPPRRWIADVATGGRPTANGSPPHASTTVPSGSGTSPGRWIPRRRPERSATRAAGTPTPIVTLAVFDMDGGSVDVGVGCRRVPLPGHGRVERERSADVRRRIARPDDVADPQRGSRTPGRRRSSARTTTTDGSTSSSVSRGYLADGRLVRTLDSEDTRRLDVRRRAGHAGRAAGRGGRLDRRRRRALPRHRRPDRAARVAGRRRRER